MNKMEKVRMKIVQKLKIEWKCLECKKINFEYFYNAPGRTRLQCDYCGKEFIGER